MTTLVFVLGDYVDWIEESVKEMDKFKNVTMEWTWYVLVFTNECTSGIGRYIQIQQ